MINELMSAIQSRDANDPESDVNKAKLPVLLVAPLGTAVPDDGVLDYQTIDTAAELLAMAGRAGTVVLCRDDQVALLSVICQNAAVFGVQVKSIHGIPNTTYSPAYDEATFGCERIAYSPLISEINVAIDVAEIQEQNRAKSQIEKEEGTYVRKTGDVKRLKDEDVSVGLDDDEDDE